MPLPVPSQHKLLEKCELMLPLRLPVDFCVSPTAASVQEELVEGLGLSHMCFFEAVVCEHLQAQKCHFLVRMAPQGKPQQVGNSHEDLTQQSFSVDIKVCRPRGIPS